MSDNEGGGKGGKGGAKLDALYKLKHDTSGIRKRIAPKIETYKLIGFKLNEEEFVIEIEIDLKYFEIIEIKNHEVVVIPK